MSYIDSPQLDRRSRHASDSGSEASSVQHHLEYWSRRGSCPAVPSASALSLSLLRNERTPERLHAILKAFERLVHEKSPETTGDEDRDSNDNEKSGRRHSAPSIEQKERQQVADKNLIQKQVITMRENRYEIDEHSIIHWLDEENFYVEFPVILERLNENTIEPVIHPPDKNGLTHQAPQNLKNTISSTKSNRSVRFSQTPLRVYSTYGPDEYNRKNPSVDPFAAFSVLELERRLEKMDILEFEFQKLTDDRLGFDIVGMGLNADQGDDKLSIFIKSITPGGLADRDGRLNVWDQIVEVDGTSLVGVSQNYAAHVLRNTRGVVNLKIARDNDAEHSEIAILCKNNQLPK